MSLKLNDKFFSFNVNYTELNHKFDLTVRINLFYGIS